MSDGKITEWEPPRSLEDFAREAASGGVVCTGCGRKLFVNRTETGKTRILRYEECRTPGCNRKFKTKQPHRVIIEEIIPSEISSAGNMPIAATESRL